ncbi:hypothetical protein [Sinisalibacter lacisalsi]|uniref:Response regulatory domain-containing protein n=1 Tax=Sinisalibacter lacisalsi TaxID=1526570 RepID=A0ABQ1QQ50_9RHOB|nr:hypothetical protein [Sinisalibacter lacisalsi]GGD40297.1 hypothetical protein GCM10011358_25260 [Sinisalibacter lacisalsi]
MQKAFVSKSRALRERDPQAMANPDRVPPRQPNIAFAALLSGYPVALIAIVALVVAGRPLPEVLLIAVGLQILVFCGVLALGTLRATSPGLPPRTTGDTPDTPPETADIWRVYPGRGEGDAASRIALISPDMEQSRSIATDLAGLGREVHHTTDRDSMFASVQARPDDWGLVIFDFDAAPDLETGVDDLLDFRSACPDMPVLLLSGGSLRSDFSSNRRPIGDATLRKPVVPRRLMEGIAAASLNSESCRQGEGGGAQAAEADIPQVASRATPSQPGFSG